VPLNFSLIYIFRWIFTLCTSVNGNEYRTGIKFPA